MLISIVIPTYNEPGLYETLAYLTAQTVFKTYKNEGGVEIVISDFDPDNNKNTFNAYIKFINNYPDFTKLTKFINIERRGTAFNRHSGIMASTGKIIVNFDADAYFSTPKAIQYLIAPILKTEGGCVLTCCDNLLNIHEVKDPNVLQHPNMALVTNALDILNNIQRTALIVCLEPGMCFTRQAYDYVNGFNDVKQWEAIFLSPRIIYSFGLGAKQHVDTVKVISSARRAVAASKIGLWKTFGNYDTGFRLSSDDDQKKQVDMV